MFSQSSFLPYNACTLKLHLQQYSFIETKHRLPGFCSHHIKMLLTVNSPEPWIQHIYGSTYQSVLQSDPVLDFGSSWNQSWGKQKPAIHHGKLTQTLSKQKHPVNRGKTFFTNNHSNLLALILKGFLQNSFKQRSQKLKFVAANSQRLRIAIMIYCGLYFFLCPAAWELFISYRQ